MKAINYFAKRPLWVASASALLAALMLLFVSLGDAPSARAADEPKDPKIIGGTEVPDDKYPFTAEAQNAAADQYNPNPEPQPGQVGLDEQKVLRDAAAAEGLLNDFWTEELQAQYGLQFDTPDRLVAYRGAGNPPCGGQGGGDSPENALYCFEDNDEHVSYALDWFASYLEEHPGGATTFLILAHEWGHAVQDTLFEQQLHPGTWNPSYLQELHADCLAGVWMEDAFRRGTLIKEPGDEEAIFGWLWEAGSGEWFAPGDHGTKEQRQQAYSDGLQHGTDYCLKNY